MTEFVDKNPSIQVRIDRGLHKLLQERAKMHQMSIKAVLEGYVADGLYGEKNK